MPTAPKGENAMSVMHHFTRDQARQFGGQFGIDREWRRSSEENDPGDLKMEEYGRYIITRRPMWRARALPHRQNPALSAVRKRRVRQEKCPDPGKKSFNQRRIAP